MFLSRFKNFSLLLEELYNWQTQWTIPDTKLREAVRLEVVEVLIPAYRSFIKRYMYSLTMVVYALPNACPIGVPDSFPMCDPSLMQNTIVKMFLLEFWAWGAGCMNECAGFLITVLYSICSSIIESDRSKGKYTHPRSWRGCWENFLRVRSS
jgi:hypothetical protein